VHAASTRKRSGACSECGKCSEGQSSGKCRRMHKVWLSGVSVVAGISMLSASMLHVAPAYGIILVTTTGGRSILVLWPQVQDF
jgi:hypothetical protein